MNTPHEQPAAKATYECACNCMDVFLYCCLDCPSCTAHMNGTTWVIWAAIKKYSLYLFSTSDFTCFSSDLQLSLSHLCQINTAYLFPMRTGAEDIAGGNNKLILGMIWTLIRHYQIGSQTKIPPKKLMLAWINAVLHPYEEISNFSSDWNDGVALQ